MKETRDKDQLRLIKEKGTGCNLCNISDVKQESIYRIQSKYTVEDIENKWDVWGNDLSLCSKCFSKVKQLILNFED